MFFYIFFVLFSVIDRKPKKMLLEKVEMVKDVESTSLDNVKVYVDNGANRNGVTATAGKTHQYTKVSNDVETYCIIVRLCGVADCDCISRLVSKNTHHAVSVSCAVNTVSCP